MSALHRMFVAARQAGQNCTAWKIVTDATEQYLEQRTARAEDNHKGTKGRNRIPKFVKKKVRMSGVGGAFCQPEDKWWGTARKIKSRAAEIQAKWKFINGEDDGF